MTRKRIGRVLGVLMLVVPGLSVPGCLELLLAGSALGTLMACTSTGNFDHKIEMADGHRLEWDLDGDYKGSLDLDVLGVLDKAEAEGDVASD